MAGDGQAPTPTFVLAVCLGKHAVIFWHRAPTQEEEEEVVDCVQSRPVATYPSPSCMKMPPRVHHLTAPGYVNMPVTSQSRLSVLPLERLGA